MRYRISENLILEVVAQFEDWHPRIGVDPEPILTFPAAHPKSAKHGSGMISMRLA